MKRGKPRVDVRVLREKAKADQAGALCRRGEKIIAARYPEVAADPVLMAKAKRIIRQECEVKVYGIVRGV